jgi:3-phosphoshikimate 1-carboxyvinyltransferase
MEVKHGGCLKGRLRPPSDKSLTHRAILFSAMGDGSSVIRNPLLGEDCRATMAACRAMGVTIDEAPNELSVISNGRLKSPVAAVDCGNSGTTMRLLSGILACRPGIEATLMGDASLSKRPMDRVANPLRLMGAEIVGDTAPLHISGRSLRAIDYASPVASAQIKSAMLLAGLRAIGTTWVSEPAKSRDHTERMLRFLGVEVKEDGPLRVGVDGGAAWGGAEYDIPADISSAAFWLVAGLIAPGSQITLQDVGVNPTRAGILEVLADAGAAVISERARTLAGEPVEDLTVSPIEILKSFTISGALVPRLIDEIPILAVLATQCWGMTEIKDAKELRVKETDRIASVVYHLHLMGADVVAKPDGMIIRGPTPLKAAAIECDGDHRIAMAFAIAGLIAEGTTTLNGCETIATSYPDFWKDMESLRNG